MDIKIRTQKIFGDILWWAGVVGLLLLSQTGIESLLYLFTGTGLRIFINPDLLKNDPAILAAIVTPIRGITLLFSLFILSVPIFQSIRQSGMVRESRITYAHAAQALLLLFVVCLIFPPGQISGLAEEYANTSLIMFTKLSTVSYHRRFLMPAIAHILFMRGPLFFLIFSFICTLALIFVLRLWFESNQIRVSFWQLISLGTTSFIYFQIRTPGYPDVLISIFILLAFIFVQDTRSKLSLFVISLASHEASLIIWFSLALTLFNAKGFIQFFVISGIYIFMLFALNDGIAGVLATRNLGEKSNLMWILDDPARALMGIVFSLKALWIMVIGAITYLLSKRRTKEAFQIIVILLSGILMIFMGVDTSRLFGWTFMAILISWKVLEHSEHNWKKIINIALIVNLLIPSVDVYMFGQPVIMSGFYQYIFSFFANF